ncbi:sensor histidine kinase [Winogradskyella forsetii]|uniref:sensor histidine kinase n=1 Tax=Winogradskyella forsetii TaxID=2686077 RepID=UPI0015BC4C29|nr:PAS domain-containing sensor histidine kinase [Winogradskyella forsetii]
MSQEEVDLLKRALAREKASRKAAEAILESKSAELYETTQQLKKLVKEKTSELQGVFENIVDAYVVMDLWGNVLKMNDAAIHLLGYDNRESDFNLLELADVSEAENVMNGFENLISEGSVTNFHVKINTKHNGQKLVHINASIILDENNKPIAAQGIVRDITLEKKFQNALEAEKQKYSSIIANMNIGLVEVDLDDRITMVNQTFINMTGYSKEELIGIKGNDILPIETDKSLSTKKLEERKQDKTDSYELRVKNKKGELRYWLVSGAPNYDIEGKVAGSIGINLDITEMKSLQLQKENLLSKLAKSNDELQEYAHIVSHDLKSPLRSIDALISWIKEDNKGKLDEVSLQNFDHIGTTLEKMEQLISDVLEYSSVGSDDTKKVEVDTDILINELIGMLYVPDHITINIKNKLPVLRGDKTKLHQLFQNLLSNAIKFIDKPAGEIIIKVEPSGDYYEFSISDNGIGIEKQFHDKIFKIFHSLNKTKESTGIGLSIVKKIVDLHEGQIWLESQPKVGTTFFFTLKK